ncbi:Unknown protein sequence [Pseudomonas syringae pv. cilantro]|uniref:Uncharacterized protein n=1 Tax=Pseudomonas syringae pv. cilantro TaxID=81035 RepID=A0A0N0XAJ6_PSESX|nr:Unknown protein sequence [Pseudomonas syringae pv. cilantro]
MPDHEKAPVQRWQRAGKRLQLPALQQVSHHPTGQATDADALRQGAFYRFGTADLTHIFQVMQVPEQQVLDLLASARPRLAQ